MQLDDMVSRFGTEIADVFSFMNGVDWYVTVMSIIMIRESVINNRKNDIVSDPVSITRGRAGSVDEEIDISNMSLKEFSESSNVAYRKKTVNLRPTRSLKNDKRVKKSRAKKLNDVELVVPLMEGYLTKQGMEHSRTFS